MQKYNKVFYFLYIAIFLFSSYNVHKFYLLKSGLNIVNKCIDLNKKNDFVKNKIEEKESDKLILHGVSYIDNETWKIWINNEVFTKEKCVVNDIEIISVSLRSIVLKKNNKFITLQY